MRVAVLPAGRRGALALTVLPLVDLDVAHVVEIDGWTRNC